jgi:hypothetical protein
MSPRRAPHLHALTLVLAIAGSMAMATSPRADETPSGDGLDTTSLLKGAVDALGSDRPAEAIAKFEALADRGVVDAVVSYDRGLAYAARLRSGNEQPGDLGRAAHAFEEARELTHDETLAADASRALARVRAEVAKRRANAGDPVEIQTGFSIGRSLVRVLPENAWALLATLASVIASAAIVARRLVRAARGRVAAATTAVVAAFVLVGMSALGLAARHGRHHLREAVVIGPRVRLLDERRLSMDGRAALAEGARVRIVDEVGGFTRIDVGDATGLVPSSTVLPLATR